MSPLLVMVQVAAMLCGGAALLAALLALRTSRRMLELAADAHRLACEARSDARALKRELGIDPIAVSRLDWLEGEHEALVERVSDLEGTGANQ